MANVLKGSNFSASSSLSGSGSSGSSSSFRFSSSPSSLRYQNPLCSSRSDFHGKCVEVSANQSIPPKSFDSQLFIQAQGSLYIGKALKWWEKGLQPNMKEIDSAEDLVNSLLEAGNSLVALDFYSPGCGGCRALHPKLCQIAEMNPDVQFLQINYEKHKPMCYSLNVHVLPFFRFYRGAHGRLCSFSCTNATIKKFKDALAKHSTERCSLGPARGLEESEIMALAANKEVAFTLPKLTNANQAPARPQQRTHMVFSSHPWISETSQQAGDRELASISA